MLHLKQLSHPNLIQHDKRRMEEWIRSPNTNQKGNSNLDQRKITFGQLGTPPIYNVSTTQDFVSKCLASLILPSR